MEYPVGWTCEATVLRLELYLRGAIAYADALCIAEHLEACPSCMLVLVRIRATMLSSGPDLGPGVGSKGGARHG